MAKERFNVMGKELTANEKGTAKYFLEMGMHCLGCPASRGESLEEACAVHGVDCGEMVEKINAYLSEK